MTIEVTIERLNEIRLLLRGWLNKETASIMEIQPLLGKIEFHCFFCYLYHACENGLMYYIKEIYRNTTFFLM